MKYNKLVRDNIPDIIRAKGGTPQTHIANEKEYWEKLKEKLEEEVKEFLESESTEELADIVEVFNAIYTHKGISFEEIKKIKEKKKEERGGFEKRIILDES